MFKLQLRQRRFIQALIFVGSENFTPETSRVTGFWVKPWTATQIGIQAHTCKYIHIQSDTYQYMQIHADICNTSRYRSIHTYTCIYIHIQQFVDASTDTYIYKQYRHKQIRADVYIMHIHTHIGNTHKLALLKSQ